MELLTQLLNALWSQDYETLANPSMIGMLYFVLFMILFLENGLLPAAFLPGDSLLVLVGVLIAKGAMGFPETLLLLTTAAKLQSPKLNGSEIRLLDRHFTLLQTDLQQTVALINGRHARRIRIDTAINPELEALAEHLHYQWQGFLWLSTNMRQEISALVILLQRTRRKWLDAHERQHLRQSLLETREHS